MKKVLSLVLTVIMLLCLMPTTSVFAASVTMVYAVNIELPVAGEKPDFSADLPNWSNAHKITSVEWVEYDEGWEWEKDMSANDTFKEGYWYVVYVHFETTSGNNFSETINPHINNETAQISGPAVQANRTKVSIYKAYQASWTAKDDGAKWTVIERNTPSRYTMTAQNRDTSFILTNTYTPAKPDGPFDVPQTGDTSNIVLYVILMIVSGSMLIILGIIGKRNAHEETK